MLRQFIRTSCIKQISFHIIYLKLGFTRNVSKHLLELNFSDSYFTFENVTYQQSDGVAMGNPLGHIFTNIFMSTHESLWLKNAQYKPILYRRYIDDTFLVFKSNANIKKFVNFLNIQHPNI